MMSEPSEEEDGSEEEVKNQVYVKRQTVPWVERAQSGVQRRVSTLSHRMSVVTQRLSVVSHRLSQVLLEQEKSLHELLAKIRAREIVIRDMTLIIGFYALGSLSLRYIEGWSFNKSLYFISSTVSTVGYGDVVPRTNLGQLVCCVEIIVGVTLVFTRIRKYINTIHKVINSRQRKFFIGLGWHVYDTDHLPIYKYSPQDVNRIINYKANYLFAFLPLAVQILIAFGFAKGFMGLTVIQAIYFTLTTCTTIGYGDYGPDSAGSRTRMARAFLSVYLFLLCILMSNTFHEMLLISVRRCIITGQSKPDIESMLLKKARLNPRARLGYYISESEYIVEALLNDNLVDRQVLLAIRRQYHWTARAGDDCRLDITAKDLYEHQKELAAQYEEHRRLEKKTAQYKLKRRALRFFEQLRKSRGSAGGVLRRVFPVQHHVHDDDLCQSNPLDQCYLSTISRNASMCSTNTHIAGRPLKDESYESWRARYWQPRVDKAKDEGIAAILSRSQTDPFTVERADAANSQKPLEPSTSSVSTDEDVNCVKKGTKNHSRNMSCAQYCGEDHEILRTTISDDPIGKSGCPVGATVPKIGEFFKKLGDSDTECRSNPRVSIISTSDLAFAAAQGERPSLKLRRASGKTKEEKNIHRASSVSDLNALLINIQL